MFPIHDPNIKASQMYPFLTQLSQINEKMSINRYKRAYHFRIFMLYSCTKPLQVRRNGECL